MGSSMPVWVAEGMGLIPDTAHPQTGAIAEAVARTVAQAPGEPRRIAYSQIADEDCRWLQTEAELVEGWAESEDKRGV